MKELEALKKKIIYRSSYRGTKEMDILLSSFVNSYIDKLSLNELEDLNKFLDFEDEDILNYYQNNVSNNSINTNSISVLFKKFKI